MEHPLLEAAEPATASGRPVRRGAARRARTLEPLLARTWVPLTLGGLALLLVSYGIVRWADTRPSYDAFGWLVWGYQTIHAHLDLGGAPSWKPLPWLFTTPFALFGSHQVTLWMTTAVAMSLAGAIFARRIAHRLCRSVDVAGWPATLAALVAGVGVLMIEDYSHYILSAQSDPVIVTCVLGMIDCHLNRRLRWAMTLGTLAALGRPEGWPLLGLYAIWLWRSHPGLRWWIVAELLVIPLLWFGVPWITNGNPNVSAKLAHNSPRQLHHNIIPGTISRFTGLSYLPVHLLALGAAALGVYKRNRALLILAASAVVWVLVEVAFALQGLPGLPRYMFEAAAIVSVLAGVSIGWLAGALPAIGRVRLPRWAGPVLAVALLGSLVPGALSRVRTERADLKLEHYRTDEIVRLQHVVASLGGPLAVRHCGRPAMTVRYVSSLGWILHMNIGFIGHHPPRELRKRHPSVIFVPITNGWSVLPWHLRRLRHAACSAMKGSFVFSSRHPNGLRTHYIRGNLS